jgi:hypothetical protein
MINIVKISKLKTFLYRLYHEDKRKRIAILWKNLHKSWRKQQPMSLTTALLLSKMVSKSQKIDGLFIKDDLKTNQSVVIKNPVLYQLFKNTQLGEWALDFETINYLEKDIKRLQPKKILEFGSGISTICLSQFLLEIYGSETSVRIYSIEQDEKYAKDSKRLIKEYGHEKYVKIIYAPLRVTMVEGIKCYTYDLESMCQALKGLGFEYCLIDGPSVSEFDGRFATLPLIKNYVRNGRARFVLDDALRAKELFIAKKWKQLFYIDIHGIVLTRRGLLTGFVKNE